MTMPLALTDQQLDRVVAAASMLPVHQRDRFLRSIGNILGGLRHNPPTAGDLEGAITTALSCYGVALGGKAKPFVRSQKYQQAERIFK